MESHHNGNTDLFVTVLSIASVSTWLFVWAFSFLGWHLVRTRYKIEPEKYVQHGGTETPGVSILRPLKGLEVNLYNNLESCILQNYSSFEVIFVVENAQDQALEVAYRIKEAYKTFPIQIIVGDVKAGINPKVNNLMSAYQVSQYDLLWVLDSNAFVGPGTLANSVKAFTTDTSSKSVGLVHHVPMPYMIDKNYIGSRLERVYLGGYHSRMYLAGNWPNITSCVNGKSNMYCKSDISRLTGNLLPTDPPPKQPGLHNFAKYLAEDNMIGLGIRNELGKSHVLTSDIVWNTVGKMTLKSYVLRRVRWSRVRRHMTFVANLVEPLLQCPLSCTIGYLGMSHFFQVPKIPFVIGHVGLWIFMEWDVSYTLSKKAPGISSEFSWLSDMISFIPFWILKELLEPPIWILSFAGSEVVWRDNTYISEHSGQYKLSTN